MGTQTKLKFVWFVLEMTELNSFNTFFLNKLECIEIINGNSVSRFSLVFFLKTVKMSDLSFELLMVFCFRFIPFVVSMF